MQRVAKGVMRALIGIFIGCLGIGCATVQYPIGGKAHLSQKVVEAPIEVSDGDIFFQARLNGKGPLWFGLDTGLQGDLIKEEHRAWAGMERIGDYRINGSEGHSLCRGGLFEFAGGFYKPKFLIAAGNVEEFEKVAGRKIDGVFGSGFLNAYVVEIDYSRRRMKLHDRRSFRYAGKGEALPLEFNHTLPQARVSFRNEKAEEILCKLIVDTGATHSMLSERRRAALEKSGKFRVVENRTMRVNGLETNALARIDELQLGRFTIRDSLVDFSEEASFAGGDGLLGANILQRFTVIFDYARKRMILEHNEQFDARERWDMSGLSVIAEGVDLRTYRVFGVFADSPAEGAGIKANDRVVEIDGEPAEKRSLSEIRQHWRQDGHGCSVGVEREGKRHTMRIELAPRI